MSNNSNNVAAPRIQFIKDNFADKLHLNPYCETELIKTIKKSLQNAGFYSAGTVLNCANIDAAVINYFTKAKGQKVQKNFRSRRTGRGSSFAGVEYGR
jgi:hypothetical protein